MAASRSRRSNAGNKMASLLDSEEVDDFYTTTYGGFSEEAEDKEYIVEPTENKRPRYLLIFNLNRQFPINLPKFFSCPSYGNISFHLQGYDIARRKKANVMMINNVNHQRMKTNRTKMMTIQLTLIFPSTKTTNHGQI